MNIIIVSSGKIPHTGGKSTHILDLKCGFENLGHNVSIISEQNISKPMNLLLRCVVTPIRIFNIHYYIHYASILLSKYLAHLCTKQKNADIIIAQDASVASAICTNKKLNHLPKFLTMHTYFGIERKLDREKYNEKIFDKMLRFELKCLNDINGIVCVDNRIRESVDKTLKNLHISCLDGKVISISNFTNIERFKPVCPSDKIRLRQKFGFPQDKFICLCARRLAEKNGVLYAIKAMAPLGERYTLIVAGSGPMQEELKQYAKENHIKNIIFCGDFPNASINELYQLSDISIVPSITVHGLQEATSITAIEGMSCGIPTIASNIGGLTQLITDMETGILVTERNDEKISLSIKLLSEDKKLYETVSKSCTAFIEKNHSHIQGAKKYLQAYHDFISKE